MSGVNPNILKGARNPGLKLWELTGGDEDKGTEEVSEVVPEVVPAPVSELVASPEDTAAPEDTGEPPPPVVEDTGEPPPLSDSVAPQEPPPPPPAPEAPPAPAAPARSREELELERDRLKAKISRLRSSADPARRDLFPGKTVSEIELAAAEGDIRREREKKELMESRADLVRVLRELAMLSDEYAPPPVADATVTPTDLPPARMFRDDPADALRRVREAEMGAGELEATSPTTLGALAARAQPGEVPSVVTAGREYRVPQTGYEADDKSFLDTLFYRDSPGMQKLVDTLIFGLPRLAGDLSTRMAVGNESIFRERYGGYATADVPEMTDMGLDPNVRADRIKFIESKYKGDGSHKSITEEAAGGLMKTAVPSEPSKPVSPDQSSFAGLPLQDRISRAFGELAGAQQILGEVNDDIRVLEESAGAAPSRRRDIRYRQLLSERSALEQRKAQLSAVLKQLQRQKIKSARKEKAQREFSEQF